MTKTLAELVTELQEDVPAVDGIPSDGQYERAIKEAVADFSRQCGLEKNSTLAIVAGTASYALPDDFLKMIEFENPYDHEHEVIITSTGIIPISGMTPFEEEVTIKDKMLTIFPTPGYSMTRYLEYKSAWILAEDESYPLTEDEAAIVMLKAKQIAFEKLSNASAASGFKYTVGNMSIDKSGVSDGYSKRMNDFESQYEAACKRYNGAAVY